MSRLWWDQNRLLKIGSRGKDVEQLKVGLNKRRTDKFHLIVNEIFDHDTELSVKTFQKGALLIDDGIAGPITQSMIFDANYSFSIQRPPLIIQTRYLCWAAALESVLSSTWRGNRKIQNAEQLKFSKKYEEYLLPRGDISIEGLDQVFQDFRVRGFNVKGRDLHIERILKFINRERKHILIIDHILDPLVAHTRVIYGVSIKEGVAELMVMDPLEGYKTLIFDDFLISTGRMMLAIPELV